MENQIQKQKTSPKEFFLHLLSIVTLYVSAISLGTVLFQVININFPDIIAYPYGEQTVFAKETLRSALSMVIIFFPVYLSSIFYLQKMYDKNPEKRELRIRKWLIYFTLFAAVIVILSSLATLVYRLLGGELTIRFFSKLLTVISIASGILTYYGLDIKKHGSD